MAEGYGKLAKWETLAKQQQLLAPKASFPWPLGGRCSCSILVVNPMNNSRKFMEVSPGKLQSRLQDIFWQTGVNQVLDLELPKSIPEEWPFPLRVTKQLEHRIEVFQGIVTLREQCMVPATEVDDFRVNLPVPLYFLLCSLLGHFCLFVLYSSSGFLRKVEGSMWCQAFLWEQSVCQPSLCSLADLCQSSAPSKISSGFFVSLDAHCYPFWAALF